MLEKHYNGAEVLLNNQLREITFRLREHKPISHVGREYRSDILAAIRESGVWTERKFRHPSIPSVSLDSVTADKDRVGLSMQVSHTDAGKAQLLDIEVLYRENEIHGCLFITQTLAEAKFRNSKNTNGSWGNTGNRVHFEFMVSQMDILQKFLKCPLSLIGLQT